GSDPGGPLPGLEQLPVAAFLLRAEPTGAPVLEWASARLLELLGLGSDATGRAVDALLPAPLATTLSDAAEEALRAQRPVQRRALAIAGCLPHDLSLAPAAERGAGRVAGCLLPASLEDGEVQRLRLALEASQDGLWDWEIGSSLQYLSPRWKAILGYEPHEFPDELAPFIKAIHPEDWPRVQQAVDAHLGTDELYDVEFRLRTKSGDFKWVRSRGQAQRDADGRPTRVVGTITDIDRRKRAEEELARERSKLASLFENMPTLAFLKDIEGRYLYVNRTLCEFFGTPSSHWVGRTDDEFLPAEIARELRRADEETLRAGTARTFEESVVAGGRLHEFVSVKFPLRDAAGVAYALAGIATDVTEVRKDAGLAALGQLLAGFAHEVRNPLFAISANVDVLRLRLGDRPDIASALTAVEHERQRMIDLAEGLLFYGQPCTPTTTRTVQSVVEDVLARLLERARSRAQRLVLTGEPKLRVRMEPERLKVAFAHLIENACHHTPEGGLIAISILRPTDLARAEVEVQVADSGPGIAEDVLPRVFEPFFTLRRGATGLGLATVRRIVEDHGGRVSLANRPGGGAVASLALPLAD
ncbi:MAG: PAS domain S-box protein, partial [Vicinamibacteria bacterium]|nr:PAS domain S-box protein [Vicinamibacteria bacterium]